MHVCVCVRMCMHASSEVQHARHEADKSHPLCESGGRLKKKKHARVSLQPTHGIMCPCVHFIAHTHTRTYVRATRTNESNAVIETGRSESEGFGFFCFFLVGPNVC